MQLLTIQEHKDLVQAVDAKELYTKLGLDPTNWSGWSKNNIANNPYALEGTDYGVYGLEANTQGGRPTTNYALSIDLAKKLAMQVRTEKGEQVRNYFLECERQAKQVAAPAFQIPQTLGEALQLAANQALQIEQDAPKVIAYDRMSAAVNSLNARDTAKAIKVQPKKFNEWCISNNWMYRDNKGNLQACSNRIQQGYMESRGFTYLNSDSNAVAGTQAMFTGKGLSKLASVFAIVHEFA